MAKYAEVGELTAVGKPLFKVADVSLMYLRAYITSEQLAKVKLGQKVTVYSDYGNKEQKKYEGSVTWISDRSEFTPKTILTNDERANLVYAVKIAVKNDGYLKIGMFVMWFFLLILILMSGLFTPIRSMPQWAQWITVLNPLKYLMQVMRAVYLRGSVLSELFPQLIALILFAVFFNSWAVKSYRKSK